MYKRPFFLALAIIVLGMRPLFAEQLPGPELPKLSNLAFGWVSATSGDPTLDKLTSFAPTMICLKDAGLDYGGEFSNGSLAFGDFAVNTNSQTAITSVGPGLLRVVRLEFQSNNAELAPFPGVLSNTRGDALEISYAQRFGQTTLGASLLPRDHTTLKLSQNDMTLYEGDVDTDMGARVGFLVQLPNEVRLGADYSYQEDAGTARYHPALTGAPDWIEQQTDFITRSQSVGASWRPQPSTLLFSSLTKISVDGDLDRGTDLFVCGVQQNVTDSLTVRATYVGGSKSIFASWRTPIGLVNASYTFDAVHSARDFLGKGNAVYVGLVLGR